MNGIKTVLYEMGVSEKYVGFFYILYAVELYIDRPDRLMFVTKEIYPDVARRYQTNWQAVERDIRTVRNVIWDQGRERLEELAGAPLKEKPCTAQILAILTMAQAK